MYVTLAFKALSEETVEHGATVVTECGRHVVVHLEYVWDIEVETFSQHLQM